MRNSTGKPTTMWGSWGWRGVSAGWQNCAQFAPINAGLAIQSTTGSIAADRVMAGHWRIRRMDRRHAHHRTGAAPAVRRMRHADAVFDPAQPLNPNVLHLLQAIDAIVFALVIAFVIRLQVKTQAGQSGEIRRRRDPHRAWAAGGRHPRYGDGAPVLRARPDHFRCLRCMARPGDEGVGGLGRPVLARRRRAGAHPLVPDSGGQARRPVLRARQVQVPIDIGDLWLGFGVTVGIQKLVILSRNPRLSGI